MGAGVTIHVPHIAAAAPPVAEFVDGLPAAIDAVAARAAPDRGFLRRAWYAAALAAYGGVARTLLVGGGGRADLALPMIAVGPRALGIAAVPGSYWPFRTLVAAEGAGAPVYAAAVAALAGRVRALRVGPANEEDGAVAALVGAARGAGWCAIDRAVGTTWLLDLMEEPWPRGSTLRKNRFHEKHLAGHGALDWSRLAGADWETGFDTLAAVERASWHGGEVDAKFDGRHGVFWRAAARDPVVAAAFHAALLRINGRPAAFSFDIAAGERLHAVANSYDPAFAKHSPGKLLQYRNLVAAKAAGSRLVDWGAGDSGYKRTMGAVSGPALRDWLLLAPGLPSALAAPVARWWRRGAEV